MLALGMVAWALGVVAILGFLSAAKRGDRA